MKQFRVEEISDLVEGECIGKADDLVSGFAPIDKAKAGDLTFLHNPSYRKFLAGTQATAVLISRDFVDICNTTAIVVPNPYYAYAKLSQFFAPELPSYQGIHPTAVVAEDAVVHPDAALGPHAVVGPGARIGAGVYVDAHVVIGANCVVGAQTRIYPKAVLYHNVVIGERVILHSGAIIGADGFGIAKHRGVWHKIAQVGRVIIEDDVEIGANTTVDRGAIGDTVIGKGCKLDNQIQIGHNAKIGAHTAMAGCSGVAGSATIGEHCIIGGGACINGHIELTDNVVVSAMTGIKRSVRKPGIYSGGLPALENMTWNKIAARIKMLNEYAKRLSTLEKKLDMITKDTENTS